MDDMIRNIMIDDNIYKVFIYGNDSGSKHCRCAVYGKSRISEHFDIPTSDALIPLTSFTYVYESNHIATKTYMMPASIKKDEHCKQLLGIDDDGFAHYELEDGDELPYVIQNNWEKILEVIEEFRVEWMISH